MQIIPAIDIINGKCVRLTEGDYTRITEYTASPLELAKMYEANGIERLHLVDLDGAKAGAVQNWKVAEEISAQTKMIVDFGGGLKSDEDLRIAFECGAAMVTGGSIAVKNPVLLFDWINEYGADRIILGADVKGLNIATDGWLETSDLTLFNFLKDYYAKGIRNVLCTDISKDGMLEGPAFELYSYIMAEYKDVDLIASGGVSCIEDVVKLKNNGIPSVVIGKAIYENKIDLKELVILNTRS